MAKKITYKSSGVDIDKGNDFVKSIKGHVMSTMSENVIQRSGAFAALFGLDTKGYKNPVLVSSTDGVGTKLLLAQQLGIHHTVGIDLVAMNVNDILCVGAKPLFFLDYIACGVLNVKVLKDVVKGIAKGCQQSGCSLIGGETAEMSDMYKPDEYDLAGFAVGVVEKNKILDGSAIKEGDCLLGFPSSGFHSNGYSLVRKVFSKQDLKIYAKEILKPTKIYVKEISLLLENFKVKGLAHMTGGAYYEKLTKVLPKGLCFQIDKTAWPLPKVFKLIKEKASISESEMYKTFNMGIGMAVVVKKKDVEDILRMCKDNKIKIFKMGHVVKHSKKKVLI